MTLLDGIETLEKRWAEASPTDWSSWATEAEAFCRQLAFSGPANKAELDQLRRRARTLHARVSLAFRFLRETRSLDHATYGSGGQMDAVWQKPSIVIEG